MQLVLKIIAIFRDSEIFVGTIGNYLFHGDFSNQTDAITGASQMMAGFNGNLTSDTIFCFLVDNEKNIWYGSSKGLTKHVGNNSRTGFTYFFENEKVFSLFQSSDLTIWAGKENGVSIFDGSNWIYYSSAEGLNCTTVYDIAEDENQIVWIATDNGVYKYTNGVISTPEYKF